MLLWYPKNDTYPEKQQSDKIPTTRKIAKKSKNSKISILHILAGSGWNDNIWPKIGPLDALTMFYEKIWYQGSYICNFENIEKIDFFENFCWPTNENVGRFSNISQNSSTYDARPAQTPLNSIRINLWPIIWPHWFYPHHFVKYCHFDYFAVYDEVLRLLFLLLSGVPRCWFSKSLKLGLSEKYMVYGVITYR